MNILSRTYYQLCMLENLMNKDLKEKLATVNYFVCENEYKLFDFNEIELFLTINKVENSQLFKDISEKCISIINMWNNDFIDLKDRHLKKPLQINKENQSIFTSLDFYALYLNNDSVKNYNSLNGKVHFIKNYNYKQYQIADLTKKCNLLNNRITAFLPDVKEMFYNYYNYLQMDKYLIESENIKEPQQKLKFWNDLLFKYETDYYELININSINGLEIIASSELRYKKGNLLSANFKTLCQNEIEKIKNHLERNYTDSFQQLPKPNPETKTRLQNSTADWRYFQIYFDTENGKEKNNDSILTPENWEQHKDTFFKQRMEKYKSSYTLEFKIKKELEYLKELTINKTDYEFLKEEYKKYLINQTAEAEKKTPDENKYDFVNNFDDVDEADVYNHFKKLVEKKMLTDVQLNEYLKDAFQKTTPPKKLFSLKNIKAKEKVYNIFYHYFKSIAQKPHGKQREYVDLLGKYFKGFNSGTIVSNWSKGYDSKQYK